LARHAFGQVASSKLHQDGIKMNVNRKMIVMVCRDLRLHEIEGIYPFHLSLHVPA
jgi:hypothetical protein